MSERAGRIHCELGPVLFNRTAVYQMCRAVPRELEARGFHVQCSALLARLAPDSVEPPHRLERLLFQRSRQWVEWAAGHPYHFLRRHRLTGLGPRWRHARGFSLFLDPLYTLFYGAMDRGVVLAYDVTPVTDPDWHPLSVGILYQAAYHYLARSRFHIITSCQNTADHLRVNWGIAPSRITVLHLGLFAPPPPSAIPEPRPGPRFLLFVGSLEPRKNIEGLIRAYGASGLLTSHGVRLRLVGFPHREEILPVAGATPGVDVAGFVSDSELAAAYRDCLAFVYPSYCEGFGLPLLEAMHHGCLCLATCTGASPEVAGDAAQYVNPYDPDALIRSLQQIVALPLAEKQSLRAKARTRAATFTWARFYEGLAAILREQIS